MIISSFTNSAKFISTYSIPFSHKTGEIKELKMANSGVIEKQARVFMLAIDTSLFFQRAFSRERRESLAALKE